MINIRHGLFETNSSSVHTMTICDAENYDAWVAGKKLYCPNDETFYNDEDVLGFCKRAVLKYERFKKDWKSRTFEYDGQTFSMDELEDVATKFVSAVSDEDAKEYYEMCVDEEPDCVPITFDRYTEMIEDYELFSDTFTTKSGDRVVAFGHYGYDG